MTTLIFLAGVIVGELIVVCYLLAQILQAVEPVI